MNKTVANLQAKIHADLKKIYNSGPESLVKTFNYVMSGQGKRIRPILTLLTSKSLFGNYTKSYNAAIAVEILHNFTLVHDDIMDNDSLRHGKETVHEKWDVATAILAGDAMLAKSINILSESNYNNNLLKSFNSALLAVCEGQALDKEFEIKKNITEKDYFEMIKKKTSYLIAMPIEIGALAYDYPLKDAKKLFNFGLFIGKAFQIQDDLLEIMSSPEIMKKSLDSDILLGKQTYPIILCNKKNKNFIRTLIKNNKNTKTIINEIRKFILENKLDIKIKETIENLYQEANNCIQTIDFKSSDLLNFVNKMKTRKK
jgi:geranylgeranyl diphosphate synthase type II|tara:strand:+ start:522 stop:1466 length:945 start_codon:yes stop_codon:yes gene_type:complete